MPVTQAQSPSTVVTEIPGRFSPIYVIDKRSPSTITSSTTTSGQMAFLPRTESMDSTFNTPVTEVDELGTNFHVGAYDDLPEGKVTLSAYDVSGTVISLLTGKAVASSGNTTYGFNDFNTANIDIIRQFADPNGNVFASMFQSDCVVQEFGFNLKNKSVAMESWTLGGFNMMKFRGFIQAKAFVVSSETAFSTGPDSGRYGFDFGALLGTDEEVVALPQPGGSDPQSMWIQNGCLNFLKVQRYNSALGWVRYPEVASFSDLTQETCYYNTTSGDLIVEQSQLITGDVWVLTYCTYATDVVVGGDSFKTIYQTTPDTSDPIAIPTRLTPFMIASNDIPRATSLDVKMTLKRERAEGIGDTQGVWGPSAAPEVSVNMEVNATDFGLNAILDTGSPDGSGNGGTVTGDFYDPNWAARYQIATAVALEAQLYDPRDASTVAKTYNLPTIVLNNESDTATTKNAVTYKYTGTDRTGNLTVVVPSAG